MYVCMYVCMYVEVVICKASTDIYTYVKGGGALVYAANVCAHIRMREHMQG